MLWPGPSTGSPLVGAATASASVSPSESTAEMVTSMQYVVVEDSFSASTCTLGAPPVSSPTRTSLSVTGG